MPTKQVSDFPAVVVANDTDLLHLKTAAGIDNKILISDTRDQLLAPLAATNSTTIVGGATVESIGRTPQRYTLAQAKASPYLQAGMSCIITDRRDGVFDVESGVASANTFDIIANDAGTLKLVLRQNEIVYPEQYGAVGDFATAGTDNLAVFQRIAAILESGMAIIGVKGAEYGVSAELLMRKNDALIGFKDLNISMLPVGVQETAMLRLDFAGLLAMNCEFKGVVTALDPAIYRTGYTVYIDATHPTDADQANGIYVFEKCKSSIARLAGVQCRYAKELHWIEGGRVEDISGFHGIGTRRDNLMPAVEKVVVRDSFFKNLPGYAVDGHSIHLTIDNCDMINCGFGAKTQLSYVENNPTTGTGTVLCPNVLTKTHFSMTNCRFEYDQDTAENVSNFVSPEFYFATSDTAGSYGNTVRVYNLAVGVSWTNYAIGTHDKFTSYGNNFEYDCPLVVAPPPLVLSGTTGSMSFDADTFDIKQFNEFFVQSSAKIKKLTINNCDITLGSVVGSTNRKIIGVALECADLKFTDNTYSGAAAGTTFRPIFVNTAGLVDDITITGNTQKDGNQPFIDNLGFSTTISGNIGITDITTGITAFAGGGQASATQLRNAVNKISVCATSGDSVKLRPARIGIQQKIINGGAAACNVYPYSGDDLGSSVAVDVPISLAAGGSVTYLCVSAGQWESV